MTAPFLRLFAIAALATVIALPCAAQGADSVPWPAGAAESHEALVAAMPAFAERLLAGQSGDAGDPRIADARFRLLLVAGRPAEAIEAIRARRPAAGPPGAPPLFLQYEIVAATELRRAAGIALDEAFSVVFRDLYGALDDDTAYRATFPLGANLPGLRADLDRVRQSLARRTEIGLDEALDLVRRFQVHQAYELLLPRVTAALAADDERRYRIERELLIATPDGARIATFLVLPRTGPARRPALLVFTIYANDDWAYDDAKRMASRGYAGLVAYTRGKGRSPDPIVPYEHDGDDARAVIEWIARQGWSDGRVGMFGGSYSAFTQWSVAKRLPKALAAMATSASAAPGIDVPMQGNVFLSFLYSWIPYVTNDKALDDAAYGDAERWRTLDRNWYSSGRAYRDLDKIDGPPSPLFRRWLDHPSYDAYWQAMIPYGAEFATIDIPVLATTGYFDGARVGVNYYYTEHLRHRPNADHTLLIGPFEHFSMQTGVAPVVEGYEIDPVGRIDLAELRLAWFDHVLRGAPRPALLADRVNYQVMGTNEWRHAPSIEAMANGSLRLFLDRGAAGLRLAGTAPETSESSRPSEPIVLTVDFADRSDAATPPTEPLLSSTLDTRNGLVFAGEPLAGPIEVAGLFSGRLEVVTNRRDFDYTVTLYEQLADGRYFQLAYHLGRASYAKSRERRELLTPGQPTVLEFRAERIVARRLEPGSRLVIVLAVPKQPDIQINYGTGKDVSDETIADTAEPLRLEWRPGSWIDVPVRQP